MKYFISDTHLGQKTFHVGTFREGFQDDEWNYLMLDCINSKVGRYDELIIVGDFSDNKPGKWRSLINCRHIMMVVGNHDASMLKLRNVFGSDNVRHMYFTKVCGVYTAISHYQQIFWDRSHHGSYHLHGHLHGNRCDWTQELIPGAKCLDIGPDNYFSTFHKWGVWSEEQVHEELRVRTGHDRVEFYGDYQKRRMAEWRVLRRPEPRPPVMDD